VKRITNIREYDDDGALSCETHTIVDGSTMISHIKDHKRGTHTIVTREVRPMEASQFREDADSYIDLGEVG
jgi:hypothetical protein